MELERSRLRPLGSVSWAGKVSNEHSLGGGKSITTREGVVVAGTPLGLFAFPRHAGGKCGWRKEEMEAGERCRE